MAAKADPHRFDDLFAEFGRITLRRMFGGEGIYADSSMFGLVVDDRIYFKTDDATRDVYLAERCGAFGYDTKDGRHVSLSYFAIPERLYDDLDELAVWARAAFDIEKVKQTATRRGKSHASPSLALGAFAARNGPQDHFALPLAKRGSRARRARSVTRAKPKAKPKPKTKR